VAPASDKAILGVQVVTQPASVSEPSQNDVRCNDALIQVMLAEDLMPSEDESARRAKALIKLN